MMCYVIITMSVNMMTMDLRTCVWVVRWWYWKNDRNYSGLKCVV